MNQELIELGKLFGQDTILHAITNQDTARDWKLQHLTELLNAIQGLKARMREPSPAMKFVASLDPQLRAALIVTLLDTAIDRIDKGNAESGTRTQGDHRPNICTTESSL